MLIRPVSEAASHLLVALASSDEKKAFVSAALARKGLISLSETYQKQVEALWEEANREALSHLNLVLKNNPQKSKEAILSRPDVKSALRWPYEQAAKKSEYVLREAWKAGEAEAVQKAKGEFKLLKEDWKGHEADEALLESLVGDLHENAKSMRSRYREALTSESPKRSLEGITRDVRLRASYSVSTGVWGVSTEVRDSAIFKAGLRKMWVAVLDAHTCSHCRALHGMVLDPKEEFPENAGKLRLRAYRGKLLGPPRHPNCRCILVPTRLKKSKNRL